jgi:hypothetical protein
MPVALLVKHFWLGFPFQQSRIVVESQERMLRTHFLISLNFRKLFFMGSGSGCLWTWMRWWINFLSHCWVITWWLYNHPADTSPGTNEIDLITFLLKAKITNGSPCARLAVRPGFCTPWTRLPTCHLVKWNIFDE